MQTSKCGLRKTRKGSTRIIWCILSTTPLLSPRAHNSSSTLHTAHGHSHWELLTPSFKDKLKDSLLLHRTAQFTNTAATTLKFASYLLCLVREQGQGGTAALGTPVSPWRGCAWSTTARTRLSSITKSVYGQNCFTSSRDLGPSSPVKCPPSATPQQAAGLLMPSSGASFKRCAENMEELLRVCLPNHPASWPGGQADTFLPIKREVYTE